MIKGCIIFSFIPNIINYITVIGWFGIENMEFFNNRLCIGKEFNIIGIMFIPIFNIKLCEFIFWRKDSIINTGISIIK